MSNNPMTVQRQAAFRAGIRTAVDMAFTAAVTIEIRDDAGGVRQQAAIAALQGLGNGLEAAFLDRPSPMARAFAMIADEPGDAGTIACPTCSGRLNWTRDPSNGHVWGRCETDGCLCWMQ